MKISHLKSFSLPLPLLIIAAGSVSADSTLIQSIVSYLVCFMTRFTAEGICVFMVGFDIKKKL